MDGLQVREDRLQGLAQGPVHGVHGTVPFAHRVVDAAVDLDLDHRLGHLGLPLGLLAAGDVKAQRSEAVAVEAHGAPREQLEGALGGLELVALVLQPLDLGQHLVDGRILLAQPGEEAPELGYHGAAPRLVRDQVAAAVSRRLRILLLVAAGVLVHGVDVDAALVGIGALADEGLAVVVGDVGRLGEEAREVHQPRHLVAADGGPPHLQLQHGDDGAQVDVAAALAVAVEGALHLRRPQLDGGDGVGHGQAGVVVGVDSERRFDGRGGGLVHARHIDGKGAAVGVAEDEDPRPSALGGAQRLQGIAGVGGAGVEEVLGVEGHLPAPGHQVGHRVLDEAQVLLAGRLEHLGDVEVPALAEEGDAVGAGLEERVERCVLPGGVGRPPGAAEGGHPGPQVQRLHLLEESEVLRVRRIRPASLDVVHAEVVEPLGDLQLVLQGIGDPLRLGPVPQGGIVDLYRGHGRPWSGKKEPLSRVRETRR